MRQMRPTINRNVYSVQRAEIPHEMLRVLPMRPGVQRQVVLQVERTAVVSNLPLEESSRAGLAM
jgi:hypothetical protein